MRRSVDVEELLDGPLDDPAALGGNLRDLERVNRWLGGTSLSAHGIDALAGDRESLTILDIGTGAADIPLALLARSARAGRRLRVTGIDSRPEVLAAAVVRRPALGATAGLELHVGDGRSLPFPDRSFDIAHASLLVHHLDPTAAVVLLREMGRVARRGIVVNDLLRGRGAWLGAWLLSHLATRAIRGRRLRGGAPVPYCSPINRYIVATPLGESFQCAGCLPCSFLVVRHGVPGYLPWSPMNGKVIEKILVLKSAHQLQLINDGKPIQDLSHFPGQKAPGTETDGRRRRTHAPRFLLDRLAQGQ